MKVRCVTKPDESGELALKHRQFSYTLLRIVYVYTRSIQAYVHTLALSLFLSFFLVYSVTCACLFIVDGRKITLDEKTGGIILSRLAFPFCKHTCIHTQTMYSRSSLVSSSLLNLLCLDSSSFLITLHFLSSSSGSASPGFRYRWWHPNPTANIFPRAVSTVSDSRPFWVLATSVDGSYLFLHCWDASYLLLIAKRRHIIRKLKKSCQKTFCRRLLDWRRLLSPKTGERHQTWH